MTFSFFAAGFSCSRPPRPPTTVITTYRTPRAESEAGGGGSSFVAGSSAEGLPAWTAAAGSIIQHQQLAAWWMNGGKSPSIDHCCLQKQRRKFKRGNFSLKSRPRRRLQPAVTQQPHPLLQQKRTISIQASSSFDSSQRKEEEEHGQGCLGCKGEENPGFLLMSLFLEAR
jgi:hypothetical protein